MFWKESPKSENFKSSKFFQNKYERNIGKGFNRVMSPRGVKPRKYHKSVMSSHERKKQIILA